VAACLAAAVEHIPFADDRAYRSQVMDVIQQFVPFDAYAFLLTDPVTTVGCSPLAEIPNLATLPHLIRLKYLMPVDRWTEPPTQGCASLQQTTDGRPSRACCGASTWRTSAYWMWSPWCSPTASAGEGPVAASGWVHEGVRTSVATDLPGPAPTGCRPNL